MLPTTRDRTDDLHAGRLWTAPAYGERTARRMRLPLVPGALVVGGWLTFYVTVLAFQPDPRAGDDLARLGDRRVAREHPAPARRSCDRSALRQVGFAAAGVAGLLGIVLAVNCRAAEHRRELVAGRAGAAAALGLAAVGLAQRFGTPRRTKPWSPRRPERRCGVLGCAVASGYGRALRSCASHSPRTLRRRSFIRLRFATPVAAGAPAAARRSERRSALRARRLSLTAQKARPSPAVSPDAPDEHLSRPAASAGVGVGGSACSDEASASRASSGAKRRLRLDPDRLGVTDQHGHADAGRVQRELGELEDLPRFGTELPLLGELVALQFPIHAQIALCRGDAARPLDAGVACSRLTGMWPRRTRARPAASRSGPSTHASCMAEQFGLATISLPSRAWSLTPATTSGIPSRRR